MIILRNVFFSQRIIYVAVTFRLRMLLVGEAYLQFWQVNLSLAEHVVS